MHKKFLYMKDWKELPEEEQGVQLFERTMKHGLKMRKEVFVNSDDSRTLLFFIETKFNSGIFELMGKFGGR